MKLFLLAFEVGNSFGDILDRDFLKLMTWMYEDVGLG